MLPFFLFSRSHFNPLPPHGGRPVLTSILRSNPAFQSTPSAWRETLPRAMRSQVSIFQSTPSAWRETTACQELFPAENISIHSLRMEGDGHSQKNTPTFNISIHSLRMEGDAVAQTLGTEYMAFQSTPSAWRETKIIYVYVGG